MVKEIRIYIEGGGDGRDGKRQLRIGFGKFFSELKSIVCKNEIRWNIILCKSRDNTYKEFKNALESHPDAFNILLVDSEAPVKKNQTTWEHLYNRDKWKKPPNATDEQCHLIVQAMEAWFIADKETLENFYGQNFNLNALSKRENVEEIPKEELISSLNKATKKTSKGKYHKIRHAAKILAQLDISTVRSSAPHCERLFTTITDKIGVSAI